MPYSLNPHIPKVRAKAVMLVVKHGWSIRQVARHIGVAPSTVCRWMEYAPAAGTVHTIPTRSSRPLHSPNAVDESIVDRIIEIRMQRGRCAEVIHAQLKREGMLVSLSTVKRTLDRRGLTKKKSKWKKYHLSGERPIPKAPGILLQMDTVHIWKHRYDRLYIFTLIDLYSRWAYAHASPTLSAATAYKVCSTAQYLAPFHFSCIQSDHGPEFSSFFTTMLQSKNIRHRHSRVRQPNDNAHIERFNRTIQDELKTQIIQYKSNITKLNVEIMHYLHYYNTQRLHLGINLKTPNEMLQSS